MNKKWQKEVGIAPETIAKMVKGEFVSMEILYRVCISLGANFGGLISIEGEKKWIM